MIVCRPVPVLVPAPVPVIVLVWRLVSVPILLLVSMLVPGPVAVDEDAAAAAAAAFAYVLSLVKAVKFEFLHEERAFSILQLFIDLRAESVKVVIFYTHLALFCLHCDYLK